MRTVMDGRWDVTTDPLAFFHFTTRLICRRASVFVESRWTDGGTLSLNQRRVRCAATGVGCGVCVGNDCVSGCVGGDGVVFNGGGSGCGFGGGIVGRGSVMTLVPLGGEAVVAVDADAMVLTVLKAVVAVLVVGPSRRL
jgi:hypothetical protein